MAFIERKWSSILDRDQDTSIGLKLPLVLDDGTEGSTKTTLESTRQNILNLFSTEVGERVMQPNLGLKLKQFLFEQFTEDLVEEVQNNFIEHLGYWLPYVKLNNLIVRMSDNEAGDFRKVLEMSVDFSLKQDPTTHDSVQITIEG